MKNILKNTVANVMFNPVLELYHYILSYVSNHLIKGDINNVLMYSICFLANHLYLSMSSFILFITLVNK